MTNENGTTRFLAFDGDQVGRRLECLVLDNLEHEIVEFAAAATAAVNELRDGLEASGCRILFCGGDSILAKCDVAVDVHEIRRVYDGISFSLGVGSTPSEALKALLRAKLRGGGAVVVLEQG